ncbi:hypothetical protein SSX86_030590 [Deinandra increscens subsp. villosa]|uniref:Phorbol-ester/DAG-type domain-containing protein n=1 Tax=Deinandra increscens subsp. villosa TaxID=3103831 RepID=A0AAP0C688_9ASTR
MKILAHEHPLTLIDLNPKYPHEEEVYDDEEDLIAKQAFQHPCHRCDQKITYLHRYYVHLECVTYRWKKFYSKYTRGADDYDSSPLDFPLSDGTYNTIIKECLFKETNNDKEMMRLIDHNSHQHPLILVDMDTHTHTTTDDDQDLCNGCVRPIKNDMQLPYYKCSTSSGCNFLLHAFCTRLPTKLKFGHSYHPRHTLILVSKVPRNSQGLFECHNCCRPCNGFAYSCVDCDYYNVDVSCAFMPSNITHKSHPYGFLSHGKYIESKDNYCGLCLSSMTSGNNETTYYDSLFEVYLHPECALLLPETITHKYDKHPMTLTYGPVEDHEGDYFCEVCEEELNPYISFYHCHKCAQSIHSACAPILTPRPHGKSFFRGLDPRIGDFYANMKGEIVFKTEDHPHPLSILRSTSIWDRNEYCRKCDSKYMFMPMPILKCLKCNFMMHIKCFK